MRRIVISASGAVLVVAAVVAAVAITSTPTPAAATGTTLTLGSTVTVASGLNLAPGAGSTFGPYTTKACHSVSLYLDGPPVFTGDLYVGGLPGQVNLMPVVGASDTGGNGVSSHAAAPGGVVTHDAVPSVEVFLRNSDSSNPQTLSNAYLYCGR
jgi:hypothetical protein